MKYTHLSRFMFQVSLCVSVITCILIVTLFIAQPVSAQLVEIPDPHLERAVREKLALLDETPFTQTEMLRLEKLTVKGSRTFTDSYLIDFRIPEVQDIIVQQAISVSECGLFDGIQFDAWTEGGWRFLVDRFGDGAPRAYSTLYTTGHFYQEHFWHDFWDANLGQPVGATAQQYQNIEGLFIREFTNGWAVYNRSGQAQTISLPESATPGKQRCVYHPPAPRS